MAYIIKNLTLSRSGSYTGDIFCTENDQIVGAFERSAKEDTSTRLFFISKARGQEFRHEALSNGKKAHQFLTSLIMKAFNNKDVLV